MAGEYYGGAPNAFAGGQLFGGALRARQLRDNALLSLIAKYGPEAADPTAAAQMQTVAQNDVLNPLEVEDKQREAAAARAAVDQYGPIAGDPKLLAFDEGKRLNAGQRVAALLQTVKSKGGDLGQALDFSKSALQAIGIPSDQIGVIRDELVKNPAAVDQFIAMLQDPQGHKALSGGQAFYDREGKYGPKGALVFGIPTSDAGVTVVPGLTPAIAAQREVSLQQGQERVDVARGNLALGHTKIKWDMRKQFLPARAEGVEPYVGEDGELYARVIPGSKAAQEMNDKLTKDDEKDQSLLHLNNMASSNYASFTDNFQKAKDHYSKVASGVIPQSARIATRNIPGTDEYEANKALKTITSLIAADKLQEFRKASKTGASGFGALSGRELDLLERLRGELSNTRDPKVIIGILDQINSSFQNLSVIAQKDAEAAQARLQERQGSYIGQPPHASSRREAPAGSLSDEDLLNRYAPVKK